MEALRTWTIGSREATSSRKFSKRSGRRFRKRHSMGVAGHQVGGLPVRVQTTGAGAVSSVSDEHIAILVTSVALPPSLPLNQYLSVVVWRTSDVPATFAQVTPETPIFS